MDDDGEANGGVRKVRLRVRMRGKVHIYGV